MTEFDAMKSFEQKVLRQRGKTAEATVFLTELCESREELLGVLMHITAAALGEEIRAQGLRPPEDASYATAYLVKITRMLDGSFDVPEGGLQ